MIEITMLSFQIQHKSQRGARGRIRNLCAQHDKGGQNQKSNPPLGVTMMPLGAPSISKYGSLVRPNAQIVALRTHYA